MACLAYAHTAEVYCQNIERGVGSSLEEAGESQIVGVRERSKSLEVIADSLAGFNHSKYSWIEWDEQSKSAKFLHKPEREDIPENIKEQLIVELYSK